MNPEHLDIKTAVEEWETTPRKMLLLAYEEKIRLGVIVKNQRVLFLQDGKNIHIKPGKDALRRAYEGAENYSGFLPLNHRQIMELIKRGQMAANEFSYHQKGFDQALLLLGDRAYTKEVTLADLFVENDVSQILSKKHRAPSAMKVLITETATKLGLQLGHKPSAKEVIRKLENKENGEYALPIVSINEDSIYWDDGFKSPKKMTFRTLQNILTQLNHD